MPSAGSILIIGGERSSGDTMPCEKCATEVNRRETVKCPICQGEHRICFDCLRRAWLAVHVAKP